MARGHPGTWSNSSLPNHLSTTTRKQAHDDHKSTGRFTARQKDGAGAACRDGIASGDLPGRIRGLRGSLLLGMSSTHI